jgi:hypothetical protein
LIKSSPPSKITREDLLIVVESTGIQSPYKSKVNLSRQLCLSLQRFVKRCRQRRQRDPINTVQDPFGDLFMGFKEKRKPVLQSIMNHHGLLTTQEKRLSSEEMRNSFSQHKGIFSSTRVNL